MTYEQVPPPGRDDFLRFKRMERQHLLNFLHVFVIVAAMLGSYAWGRSDGREEGYSDGVTDGKLTQLAEVKRMCDTRLKLRYSLLLGKEFYTCKPTGERLE